VSNLSGIAIQDGINLEELRARLRKMTDAELIRFGKAAGFLCRPGKESPRECFVIQLEEARAEWARRKESAKIGEGATKMGRWVQLSKKHPDIRDGNEVCNVLELGTQQGDQMVQGQHFYTDSTSSEALELATFIKTDSALEASEAERLFKENLMTRLRDGYVHARYFNFRLNRMVYVGMWDQESQRFI